MILTRRVLLSLTLYFCTIDRVSSCNYVGVITYRDLHTVSQFVPNQGNYLGCSITAFMVTRTRNINNKLQDVHNKWKKLAKLVELLVMGTYTQLFTPTIFH